MYPGTRLEPAYFLECGINLEPGVCCRLPRIAVANLAGLLTMRSLSCRYLVVMAAALLHSPAWAHDPIFGIGPHTLFKGGVEISPDLDHQETSLRLGVDSRSSEWSETKKENQS